MSMTIKIFSPKKFRNTKELFVASHSVTSFYLQPGFGSRAIIQVEELVKKFITLKQQI